MSLPVLYKDLLLLHIPPAKVTTAKKESDTIIEINLKPKKNTGHTTFLVLWLFWVAIINLFATSSTVVVLPVKQINRQIV